MTKTKLGVVIQGNRDALMQGLEFIQQLDDAQYQAVPRPFVSSSVGQHIRHIVDMYRAVFEGCDREYIDYDVRRRGAAVESCRKTGESELISLLQYLDKFDKAPCEDQFSGYQPCQIKTEVALNETQIVSLASSLERELVFASSHAVHHYALMSVIARLQGISVDAGLGQAPATASYVRSEAAGDQLDIGEESGITLPCAQ